MGEDDELIRTLLDGVVMTPAERAVIRERVEQMKVDLDDFLKIACDEGDARGAVHQWAQFACGCEAVAELFGSKIKQQALRRQG